MAGFSTRCEEAIDRKINVKLSSVNCSEEELISKYDLKDCVQWIIDNRLEKVCLQFPDSLLGDSVQISLWMEKKIGKKLYILGDTSYGSCCVDEVAAEHVKADGIIHFGHACLSPTIRLTVLYIFPKYLLNITKCISVIRDHCKTSDSKTLLIIDVGFCHYSQAIEKELSDCDVVIAEPIISKIHTNLCSKNCCLQNGSSHHSTCKLGRGYCLDDNILGSIIFIGPKDSRVLHNFQISFGGSMYCYSDDNSLENISPGRNLRQFYVTERLKDAKTVGIIIATLGVSGYLEAIKRVRNLVKRKGKKCYVISVGKPTIAKLANFSEIDVYVIISCPETVLENEKEFYQPILSVMEAEVALNEGRSWSQFSSSDFRDILPGGRHFVDLPENNTITEPDVSLVTNKIRYNSADVEDIKTGTGLDGTVQLLSDMTVDKMTSHLSTRGWRGLDPMLGEVPVAKAVQGRSGIPEAYSEEEQHFTS